MFCVAINYTNNSKSKVSIFKFTQDPKLKREWLIEIKRECFTPLKHSRICAELSTGGSLEQNLTVRSLLGVSFTPHCRCTDDLSLHCGTLPDHHWTNKRRKTSE